MSDSPLSSAAPDTRSRPWLAWLLLSAALVVVAGVAVFIDRLRERADECRRVQTELASLHADTHELDALEWKMIFKEKLDAESSKQLDKIHTSVRERFSRLGLLGSSLLQLEEFAKSYRAYVLLADQELKLIAAGKIQEAEALDKAKVDPAFDALETALKNSEDAYDKLANRTLGQVRAGTVLVLLSGAGLIAALVWQLNRKRRKVAIAVAEERALRQAHEILELRVRERTAELSALTEEMESRVAERTRELHQTNHALATEVVEHTRAAEELNLTAQRLNLATQAALVGIWELDLEKNVLVWDKRMYELYGIRPEDFGGAYEAWEKGVHPDDLVAARAEFHDAIAGKNDFHTQFRVVYPDGQIHFVEAHAVLQRAPNGTPQRVVGVNWDITERKRTEAALQERARLAMLEADVGSTLTQGGTLAEMLRRYCEAIVQHLDAAFARIWIFNEREKMLELQASAGIYTHLNGPHGRVPFGQFKIGLIGEERKPHLTNQVVGDPRVGNQEWAKCEGMVAFAGYPLLVENRLVGVVAMFARHTLAEMTLTALASVSNHIAAGIQRNQTENALRESEDRLRDLFESATDLIQIVSPDGHFLFVNRAWKQTLGYTDEEVSNLNVSNIVDERSKACCTDAFHRLMNGEELPSMEAVFVGKQGQRIAVEGSVNCRRVDGKPGNTRGIFRDVTARRQTQAELENVHQQLLEASRRDGMAEIATNVLHNVGNVLNSVNISTGLIVESVKQSRTSSLARVVVLLQEHAHDLGAFITTDPRGKHVPAHLAQLSQHLLADQTAMVSELDSLRRNVEHIKGIVAMQQSYATFGGVKELINVVHLVEDSLRLNEGAFSHHGVEIIRDFEKVPLLNVEKHKILQILVNLLRNAKHACDESECADKRVTVRVTDGEGRVKISVMDNGIGIPPENLTCIFNHGFTTRKDGHGFGLHSGALAAQEMGGSLTVHSAGSGQGATFTLELPC